jgi:TM2 domain-containing membrane protein YozV
MIAQPVAAAPPPLPQHHQGVVAAHEVEPTAPTKYCPECGEKIRLRAEICPHCGVRQPAGGTPESRHHGRDDRAIRDFAGKKIAAGICGILLGALGIHKFILGLTTPGIIMLLVSILTCGFGAIVMAIIGLVEGIIYLTKTDEDFYRLYGVEQKGWF